MATKGKKSNSIFASARKQFGNPSYGRREFRRDLGRLQRSGLISDKVDVKSQNVTDYMLRTIRKFGDVLQGKAQTVKVTPKEKKYYKETGHRTKGHVAIIETPRGEKVKRLPPTKDGIPRYEVLTKGPKGTRRATQILVPETDLERYITFLVEDAPDLKKDQYYGIRFYGNNLARYFGGDEAKRLLMQYLLAYADTKHNTNFEYDVANEGDETYKNFEVVEFFRAEDWEQEIVEQRRVSRETRNVANRQRYNDWLARKYAAMTPLEKRYYNERRRESTESATKRKRVERQKIAESDPEKLLANREAAKIKMRQLRAKRKQDKK